MKFTRMILLSTSLAVLAACLIPGTSVTNAQQQAKGKMKKRKAANAKVVKAEKVDVQLIGVAVSKPAAPPSTPEGQRVLMNMMNPPLNLTFGVAIPDRTIVGIDEVASKLTELTDDKGTNLLGTSQDSDPGSIHATAFEKDPHWRKFEVHGRAIPAQGATKISVKANVVVLCSDKEKTAEQKDIVLNGEGTEVTLGPIKFKVSAREEKETDSAAPAVLPFLGNAGSPFSIEMSSTHDFDETVKEFNFFDADGKPVRVNYSGGGGGGNFFSYSYGLAKKLDKVTIKMTYHDNVEAVHVPVGVTLGLGL